MNRHSSPAARASQDGRARWLAYAHSPAVGILVLASAVALPLVLHRGFVLVADMTFVPEQPWKGEWLGTDGSVPRAVPADALVSVLTRVVPGDLLQKVILVGIFLLAGAGTVRLLRDRVPAARFGGATLYVWNAWVFERLAIGHWGLLVGYAALPWVVHAALDVRRGGVQRLGPLVLWLGLSAATSPTGGLVAALTALAVGVRRRPRAAGIGVAVAGIVVNLPWLVPALLHTAAGSDPVGVRVFAARADSPFGTAGSLLTFGGIWKAGATPGDRSSPILVGATFLLVLASLTTALAAGRARRVEERSSVRNRLAFLALGSFLLAYLPASRVGRDTLQFLVGHVLGAGILRDSQKWLVPFVLVASLGFGLALDLLSRVLRRRAPSALPLVVAGALLPVVLLPSLAWGLAGRLAPVQYPAEWFSVRAILASHGGGSERVAVFPWSTYQRLPWNDLRAALDPAIRFFPGQVVTSQDLVIDAHTTVTGEDAEGARIGAAVRSGAPLGPVLAREGIRYVLLEKTAAGAKGVRLPPGRVLHDGTQLELLDLGNPSGPRRSPHRSVILAADVVALLAVLAGAAATIGPRARIRPRSRT